MKFTVLGSTGFIGRHMTQHLRAQGIDVETPPRGAGLKGKNLGHVIYAIGLAGTSTFRRQPRAAVDAHVNILQRLLEETTFDSWLYLSSTRIYSGLPAGATGREDERVSIMPSADALYDLTKLLGESICLNDARDTVRIARLSNVYGAGQSQNLFLGAILASLQKTGEVTIQEGPLSAKDYISVTDVVKKLQAIALTGRERIYNVASGKNVTHQDIAAKIISCGKKVAFAPDGVTRIFPTIDTTRMVRDFGPTANDILTDLPLLLN